MGFWSLKRIKPLGFSPLFYHNSVLFSYCYNMPLSVTSLPLLPLRLESILEMWEVSSIQHIAFPSIPSLKLFPLKKNYEYNVLLG